jgi:drug/metabolite transporter (DMT)-like permease
MKTRVLSVAGAALVTIFFWGSAFAGIRAGLHSYSPAHLALLRFLTASAVLGVVALVTRMRMPAVRDIPLLFGLGLAGFALYHLSLNAGEMIVPAGPASVLIQTAPIWTALMAVLFLRDRLRAWGWIGILVSFSGAAVIGLAKDSGFGLNAGAGLILLSALSTSIYFILQKTMMSGGDRPPERQYRPVEVTTYAVWAGTILLLPFAGGLGAAVRAAPLADTLAAVYLGVAPTALGYVTWAIVLSRLPASRASSLMFFVPVVAFLVGWVWLGEAPTWLDVAGGLLALGGVAIVNTIGRAPSAGTPGTATPARGTGGTAGGAAADPVIGTGAPSSSRSSRRTRGSRQ